MKGVFLGLIILVVLIVLYFRSCSGFTKEPAQTTTEVAPTQLPPVAPAPPTPVTEPSPVLPQPIPDVQPTATESDDFPESLSISPFFIGSDLSEIESPSVPSFSANADFSEVDPAAPIPAADSPKLVKLEGPEVDMEMERRQLYSEWSP
jgi:hypothetical protein